jgi:hypothetical protein
MYYVKVYLLPRLIMKLLAITGLIFACCCGWSDAYATSNSTSNSTVKATPDHSLQAANRKGSTRVGGSNSKGKGSRYVGGYR